jgi:hypothetical protein
MARFGESGNRATNSVPNSTGATTRIGASHGSSDPALPSDSLFLLGPRPFETYVRPSSIEFRFHASAERSSFRRVFSMNLMMAPVSFQRLGEWHDTCISNCEAGGGRPPRTRSDSNGNLLQAVLARLSKGLRAAMRSIMRAGKAAKGNSCMRA